MANEKDFYERMNLIDKDYTYRMRLDIMDSPPTDGKNLNELVREELRGLLDVIILYKSGQPIEPDAYSFISDPTDIQTLF